MKEKEIRNKKGKKKGEDKEEEWSRKEGKQIKGKRWRRRNKLENEEEEGGRKGVNIWRENKVSEEFFISTKLMKNFEECLSFNIIITSFSWFNEYETRRQPRGMKGKRENVMKERMREGRWGGAKKTRKLLLLFLLLFVTRIIVPLVLLCLLWFDCDCYSNTIVKLKYLVKNQQISKYEC